MGTAWVWVGSFKQYIQTRAPDMRGPLWESLLRGVKTAYITRKIT